MTTVEIEYCVPCCSLEYAIETQETLFKEFGRDLDEAAFLDELWQTVSDDGLLMEFSE